MGRGKGTPNSVIEDGCTPTKIIRVPLPSSAFTPRSGHSLCCKPAAQGHDFSGKDASAFCDPPKSFEVFGHGIYCSHEAKHARAGHGSHARRYMQLHTIPEGFIVACHAMQFAEDWSVWVHNNFAEAERTVLRQSLTTLIFSRDGLVPFDPACLEMSLGHIFTPRTAC